jgi:hypothetical protein
LANGLAWWTIYGAAGGFLPITGKPQQVWHLHCVDHYEIYV